MAYENSETITELIKACREGNLEEVKRLVGKSSHLYNEALSCAVIQGDLETVKHLIEEGADIHVQDDAALKWAVIYGYADIVKYLIEKGANVHVQDDFALRSYVNDIEMVKYLTSKGADVNALDGSALKEAVQRGNLEVAKVLVEAGADIKDGKALTYAVLFGFLEIVKYLVECGADVRKVDLEYTYREDIMLILLEKLSVEELLPLLVSNDKKVRKVAKFVLKGGKHGPDRPNNGMQNR